MVQRGEGDSQTVNRREDQVRSLDLSPESRVPGDRGASDRFLPPGEPESRWTRSADPMTLPVVAILRAVWRAASDLRETQRNNSEALFRVAGRRTDQRGRRRKARQALKSPLLYELSYAPA